MVNCQGLVHMPSEIGTLTRVGESGALAQQIKSARARREMTLAELASRVGVDKGYLSRVERGLKIPSISTLLKIAETLEVPVSQLFGESVDESAIHVSRAAARGGRIQDRPSGYGIETLTTGGGRDGLEGFLISPPKEFRDDHIAKHGGEELLYVVSGEVEVRFVDRVVQLGCSDSVQFPGHYQHQVRRTSPSATVLVVISRS